MSNNFGSEGQWKFMFFCAFLGFCALVAGICFAIAWVCRHFTYAP